MFLNFLKNFFLKNKLKNSLVNINFESTTKKVDSIGVLIDESIFTDKELLLKSLEENFFEKQNIKILLFRNTIKKTENFDYPIFSNDHLSWNGTFEKQEINDFLNQNFDLLINYYDTDKTPLLYASMQSKATFKVGFSSVDKRLNQFMIDTTVENYNIFVTELFKYLKILNKI